MTSTREVAQVFLDAFASGSLNGVRASFARAFVYELRPSSVGVPPMDADGYVGWANGALKGMLRDKVVKIVVDEVIQGQDPMRLVIHAHAADSFGVNGVPYTNEYVFIFSFVEEDGSIRISRILEFIDSAFFAKFGASLAS